MLRSTLSFPRISPHVVSYGQQSYQSQVARNASGPIVPHGMVINHPVSQPPAIHPGGASSPSPFIGFAPGIPVQQQQTFNPPPPPPVIAPLPYDATCAFPHGYASTGHHMFVPYSSANAYHPGFYQSSNFSQRMNTPVSLSHTLPAPSHSMGFVGVQRQSSTVQKTPRSDPADDCFNLFWIFCLLGPLTWPCALFGVCSDRRSERIAGFFSLVMLTLCVVIIIVILSEASKESNSYE
eukprot:g4330.t1